MVAPRAGARAPWPTGWPRPAPPPATSRPAWPPSWSWWSGWRRPAPRCSARLASRAATPTRCAAEPPGCSPRSRRPPRRARRGASWRCSTPAGRCWPPPTARAGRSSRRSGPEAAAEARRTGQPRLFVRGGGARPEVVIVAPARVLGGEVVGCALGRSRPGAPTRIRCWARWRAGAWPSWWTGRGGWPPPRAPAARRSGSECAGALAGLARQRQPGALETAACAGPGGAAELVAFAPLAGLDWGVVVRQPLGEAYPSRGAAPLGRAGRPAGWPTSRWPGSSPGGPPAA